MAERLASIKDLKTGFYVIIDDEPCKVLSIILSKPGKHGSSKARIEAVGIFDDKKRSLMKPADAEVKIPIIEKKNAQVISVSGDTVQLMDLGDYSMFESNIPEEFKGKLQSGTEILYWKLGDRFLLKEIKS
jgi:translation initiation factor 5A